MPTLFADGNGLDGGTIAGLVTLVGAISAAVATLSTRWWEQRKQKRLDVLAEWQQLADRLQAELNSVRNQAQADVTALRNEALASQREHRAEVRELQQRHSRCEVETAELKGELKVQQLVLRRLQAVTGDTPPETIVPGIIVADLDGIIKLASPSLGMLLHYLPSELRGKNVEMLIPEDIRHKHRESLARFKERIDAPWPDISLATYALTSEGMKIPVTITLSGWQSARGDWTISAEVRRRFSSPTTA